MENGSGPVNDDTWREPLAEQPSVEETASEAPRLSVWNPGDHLALLNWIFFRPDTLKAYLVAAGDDSVKQVGAWVSGSWIWLPVFLALVALAFTPGVARATNLIFLALAMGAVLGGFGASWLSQVDPRESAYVVNGAAIAGAAILCLFWLNPLATLAVLLGGQIGLGLAVTLLASDFRRAMLHVASGAALIPALVAGVVGVFGGEGVGSRLGAIYNTGLTPALGLVVGPVITVAVGVVYFLVLFVICVPLAFVFSYPVPFTVGLLLQEADGRGAGGLLRRALFLLILAPSLILLAFTVKNILTLAAMR
ncbi:MAG: hypothetical protein IT326_01535 [Anaerolineae bacterium]|nr:hypothetical protein [Anaerolineae bacterium]